MSTVLYEREWFAQMCYFNLGMFLVSSITSLVVDAYYGRKIYFASSGTDRIQEMFLNGTLGRTILSDASNNTVCNCCRLLQQVNNWTLNKMTMTFIDNNHFWARTSRSVTSESEVRGHVNMQSGCVLNRMSFEVGFKRWYGGGGADLMSIGNLVINTIMKISINLIESYDEWNWHLTE